MPPFLPRKRLRTPSPEPVPSKSKGKGKAIGSTTPRKPTLFDALDAGTSSKQTAQKTKSLLAKLAGSDDESDLTSLSSTEPEFEDVPAPKRQRIQTSNDSDDEEDDDIEFEDVHTHAEPKAPAPPPSGDLELTLTKERRISLVNPHNKKQGPSKIERQIRVSTHCMHVQFLLWHNWIRNMWISDEEVQQTLVMQLGPNVKKEIERWRVDSGIEPRRAAMEFPNTKIKENKGQRFDTRSQRDWGEPAERLATGAVNMSHGDPLFRLMRALSAYWKKRFRITAPGLRKLGYMSLAVLDDELRNFSKDPHDSERHGERICDVAEFRSCAKACQGSRDLSAQLFTALLRGLGLEARIVVSLQPVGFGWSKNEDAVEQPKEQHDVAEDHEMTDSEGDMKDKKDGMKDASSRKQAKSAPKKITKVSSNKTARSTVRASDPKDAPIDVSDSEVGPSDDDIDDESSVVDVTPNTLRRGPSKSYENDIPPNYWVEVLSPVTNTYYAVNPLNVGNPVATNPKLLAAFEPRGAKSEKAKQVMAYIVGFSPDGTAKDVTVRYLRRHMWPGKTKGFRMPVEKVPIYNHKGKIKRYEEYDWFKTVISRYKRNSDLRAEVDEHEDATDLKAIKPEKKEVKEGEETLQSYKSSPEFVLERHLRREEALLPAAKHVKLFNVKGKKGEPETEEKVFLRKDVVHCKSVETWHKEGREPKMGEQPLKRVPYRAATTNRKRELAEAEAASGEKMLQGLYSWDQTDWIIPPPIVNGIIPKNGYGNMDVYVPSMVPVGAVHIPRRRTKEICRRLGIDYAEAVTGFEFGARMAVPIITGVVIAEENEEMVLEQWEKDEAERARKEDEKRTKAALGMWRKFLMGMRIVERVREEYGDDVNDNVDVLNPWINTKSRAKNACEIEEETQRRIMDQRDEGMAGGFLLEGHDEEEPAQSFFPTRHDDNDDDDDGGGGFIVEADEPAHLLHKTENVYATPISMLSNKRTRLDATSEGEDEYISTTSEQKRQPPKSVQHSKSQAESKNSVSSRKPNPKPRASAIRGKRMQPLTPSNKEGKLEEQVNSDTDEGSPPARKVTKRCAAQPNTQPQRRAVPKRKAARKSETALKSHYFENSGNEDDD
jgi:xeroderma pigmentosum group C-complementing protein